MRMCKNETYNEDIIRLIKGGYKIYLDKKCEGGVNRHVFYKTLNDKGHHFYHIRYTISDNNDIQALKDFPSVTISGKDLNTVEEIVKETANKIENFIKVNGYEISCDRRIVK